MMTRMILTVLLRVYHPLLRCNHLMFLPLWIVIQTVFLVKVVVTPRCLQIIRYFIYVIWVGFLLMQSYWKKSIREVFDSVNLIVEHNHLYFDKVAKGDLMQKAVNYMHTFWEQLFRYRNDGNYTIDNSLAERSIRPMTVERKNSLFFCSKEGAKASAIFHTIIETCKQLGLSAREYIKNFLKEVSLGRTDWQNLTPAKIYI